MSRISDELSQLVDKHLVLSGAPRDERALGPGPRRRMGRQGGILGDWAMHS